MTDLSTLVNPQVGLKFRDNAEPQFYDLAALVEPQAGETFDAALRWSDPELIAAVARYLDRPASDFAGMKVSRPESGNILISQPFEYG